MRLALGFIVIFKRCTTRNCIRLLLRYNLIMKRKNQEEILGRHNVMLSSIMVSSIFYAKVTVRTNKNSVSMEDMAAATTKAASMASEMGVAEDSLSAMIGTIEARTKASGEEVGTGIKSLLINLQNINNSKIVSTLDKAGISMTELKDGVEQMRDPISILEDLQKVFNSLDESDPLRSEILTNIGQKYHAKVCVAVQKCAA